MTKRLEKLKFSIGMDCSIKISLCENEYYLESLNEEITATLRLLDARKNTSIYDNSDEFRNIIKRKRLEV